MKEFMTSWIALVLLGSLAAAQTSAQERVERSPRHHELVTVKHGDRSIECYLVLPQVEKKVPAVVVIHENRGLTEWVRGLADQVAEAGYVAIAPDLLSGSAPGGGNTGDFPSEDAARQAISKLDQDQVTADLHATADHVARLPACSGKLATAGYCWGGRQAFLLATNHKNLAAAFVFYGTPPEAEAMAQIQCPVYGFYGGNDARVNSSIPDALRAMRRAGKKYEPVTYEGAEHGFMRSGESPDASAADKQAREDAWQRWKELLGGL